MRHLPTQMNVGKSRLEGLLHHIPHHSSEVASAGFCEDPVHYKNDWDVIDKMRAMLTGDYRMMTCYDENNVLIQGHPFSTKHKSFTAYLPSESLLTSILKAFESQNYNLGKHSSTTQEDNSHWWRHEEKNKFVLERVFKYLHCKFNFNCLYSSIL